MIDVKVKEMEGNRAENTALSVTKKGSTFTLERGNADADAMDFMLAVDEYMISAALALSEKCNYRISPQSALDIAIAQMVMASTIFEREGLEAVIQKFAKDMSDTDIDDFCISLKRDDRRWYFDAGYVSNSQFILAMLVMGTDVRNLVSNLNKAMPFMALVASNVRVYADDVFRAIEEGVQSPAQDESVDDANSHDDMMPCRFCEAFFFFLMNSISHNLNN